MSETLPIAVSCVQCGKVFGALLNATRIETRGAESPEAICMSCVTKLRDEKGIEKLDSPEAWAKLLEN